MDNVKHPKFYPAYEEIKNVNPKISDGEKRLLEFLYNELDDKYEVYYKSFILSKNYNILVWRDDYGILLIDVCSCKVDDYTLVDENKWIRKSDNLKFITPQKHACNALNTYKSYYISDFYGESIIQKRLFYALSSIIFFSEEEHCNIEEYYEKYRTVKSSKNINNILFMGNDDLDRKNFERLFARALNVKVPRIWVNNSKKLFTEWLVPIKRKVIDKNNITLNAGQEKIIKSLDKKGAIKFRGAAGSGKTQVLKEIWKKEKNNKNSVLYLTFNISLRNYIINMGSSTDNGVDDSEIDSDIMHYHIFISKILDFIGVDIFDAKRFFYNGKFKNIDNMKIIRSYAGDSINESGKRVKDSLYNKICDCDWSAVIKKYISDEFKYDVIIIDEHQDYKANWTKNIRAVLANRGKIIFAYDDKQDVYSRADIGNSVDGSEPYYTGIRGQSSVLKTAYRIPAQIAFLCNEFASEFLAYDGAEKQITIDSQTSIFVPRIIYCAYDNVKHKNYFIDVDVDKPFNASRNKIDEKNEMYKKISGWLDRILDQLKNNNDIIDNSTCILSNSIAVLRECEYYLRKSKKYAGCLFETNFENKEEYEVLKKEYNSERFHSYAKKMEMFDRTIMKIRQNKKYRFGISDSNYKMCTVQSFKGFEADNIILLLVGSNKIGRDASSLLYCALTRAKKNLYILDINTHKHRKFFKKILESFEDDMNFRYIEF